MNREGTSPIAAMILGVVVLKLIELIPILGCLVRFVAVIAGLGAILIIWCATAPDRQRSR